MGLSEEKKGRTIHLLGQYLMSTQHQLIEAGVTSTKREN
jgi:hypothetical protein